MAGSDQNHVFQLSAGLFVKILFYYIPNKKTAGDLAKSSAVFT